MTTDLFLKNIEIKNTYEDKDVINENSLALIDKIFTFTNKSIKIYGSSETPYFCGKDIADILEYEDAKRAIQTHVRDKNKKPLREILNVLGGYDSCSLKHNDLQSIYLSEAGLYELIFKSKMKKAIIFKDWVFEEVLPSIRKIGQEKYLKQLNEKDNEILEKTNQLKISECKNLDLIGKIKDVQVHKNNGWVYIATNDQYALNNHFRIGRTKDLINRLRAYNPGRTISDKLYYVFIYKTENMNLLELLLRELLIEYREDPVVDMYVLPWRIIYKFTNYICNVFHNGIIINKNELIIDNINCNDTPIIPLKINVKNLSEQTDKNCMGCLIHCNKDTNCEENKSICMKCPAHCYDNIEIINNVEEAFKEVVIEHNGVKYIEKSSSDLKVEEITRACKTCKVTKELDSFELWRLNGNRRISCIECINVTQILCKTCNELKIGSNYEFTDSNLRRRTCKECSNINKTTYKICRKCNVNKLNVEYDLYENGIRRNECRDCMPLLHKGNSKKCRNCKKLLPKNQFLVRADEKRNRICNTCRKL